MIDNLSVVEKEVLILALGCFGKGKLKEELIWRKNANTIELKSTLYELSNATSNLYYRLLKDIKGDEK